jgi:cyclase
VIFQSAVAGRIAAAGLVAAVAIAGSVAIRAQQPRPGAAAAGVQPRRPPAARTEVSGLEVLRVRPNFYVIAGAGAHVAVQVGPDGLLLVDAGSAAKTDAVLAAIKSISDRPIRYIINTSASPDHVGGNAKLAAAGRTIFNTDNNPSRVTFTGGAATIVSTENVVTRMSQPSRGVAAFPPEALSTEPFFEKRKVMYFNGEGIEILAQPSAYSDGDAMVFFRRSDVVVAGELLDTTRFPVIDLASGGGVQGVIDGLRTLVEIAIPSVPFDWRDDGTVVVGARGRVCDQIDVAEYRDMVTVIRDRIRNMIGEGKTLPQVIAANPTQGYTKRYGTDAGPWTTRMFVEAVFNSLSKEDKP